MVQKIEALIGPMNSGKSTELIRRLDREQRAGSHIIAFKPNIDSRQDQVKSRNGTCFPAFSVESSQQLLETFIQEYEKIRTEKPNKKIVVGIDEAQFFDQELTEIITIISRQFDSKVVISGLLRDFRREGFGPMPAILTISQEIVTFSAICSYIDPQTGEPCGEEAYETYRSLNGAPSDYTDPVVLPGDVEQGYEAYCLNHHVVTNHPQDNLNYSK